ncbi:putative virus X resistance protein-like, coiled-coil [Helianthus anomalus]
MTDPVVEFALENLKQVALLLYNSDFKRGVEDQVDPLYKEVRLIKSVLEDPELKHSDNEYTREIARQIRDLAYKGEDAIDTFLVDTAMQKERRFLSRMFHKFFDPPNLQPVAKTIESIKIEVNRIYNNKRLRIEAGESSNQSSPSQRRRLSEEENVIGFDEEANVVVSRLTDITKSLLEVVAVVGMGGLGKTTLVKMVYFNSAIKAHFSVRVWVSVSHEYNRKEVLCAILGSLRQPCDQISKMNEEMIIEEICTDLKDQRYLIVLDNVWTPNAWSDLKKALPNQDCGSKILLATRITEVALLANPDTPPHHLRFLNDDESFALLCTKVFGKQSCPSDLVELGKTIAKECDGLPLAIVVISNHLLKIDKIPHWWRKVAKSVGSYVARDPRECLDVLALSYHYLSDHLKKCFLYFAAFPRDLTIHAQQLVMLWVAEEELIQQNGQECVEDLAEEKLEDLVKHKMILVVKKGANGSTKTCRLQGTMHDMCLRETKHERSLQVINQNLQEPNLSGSSHYHRRVSVHSRFMNVAQSKHYGRHIHSLLCFASEERELPGDHTSSIHESYKLLRVLHMSSMKFPHFPVKITQFLLLKYISINGNIEVLPTCISRLWRLRALVIKTTSRHLDIQVDIWNLPQLRHLDTNAQTTFTNKEPFVQENIQTMSTISPDSCTILARTPNLKKLGIRGELAVLMEVEKNANFFDNLAKLDKLEKLKLLSDTFPRFPFQGELTSLPPLDKFPPRMNKLTLSDTFLEWKHMPTLYMLPNLEVLKLKANAFKGCLWKLEGVFHKLIYLHIEKMDLADWKASGHHFPKLEHVVVKDCDKLNAIPHGLADAPALQTITLHHTPSAIASARLIQEKKQVPQQHDMKSNRFELRINPLE